MYSKPVILHSNVEIQGTICHHFRPEFTQSFFDKANTQLTNLMISAFHRSTKVSVRSRVSRLIGSVYGRTSRGRFTAKSDEKRNSWVISRVYRRISIAAPYDAANPVAMPARNPTVRAIGLMINRCMRKHPIDLRVAPTLVNDYREVVTQYDALNFNILKFRLPKFLKALLNCCDLSS